MQANWYDFTIILICLFFSVMPPFIAVSIRESVKKQRQLVIADLDRFFDPTTDINPAEGDLKQSNIIDSFEFVKFKYLIPALTHPHSDLSKSNDLDFRKREWLYSSLPLVFLLMILNIFTSCIIAAGFNCTILFFLSNKLALYFSRNDFLVWEWVFVAAYAGAYTYMIRAFFQAINNFDLSPASFFGAISNLLLGVALPLVIYFSLFPVFKGVLQPYTSGLLVFAFAGGYMPAVLLRQAINSSDLRQFKKDRSDIFTKFTATPLEVIDGIDSAVRDRLSDLHVSTVQNLASANPIMLFVETPFGFYQTLDWVAQAQLCASVGPDALFKLWALGVRSIFDLERLALHPEYADDEIIAAVGKVILTAQPGDSPQAFCVDAVRKNIITRIDNVYTLRLRQIMIRIGEKFGNEVRLLPPLVLCSAAAVKSRRCPFEDKRAA